MTSSILGGSNSDTNVSFDASVDSAGASRANNRNELRRVSGPSCTLCSTTPKLR